MDKFIFNGPPHFTFPKGEQGNKSFIGQFGVSRICSSMKKKIFKCYHFVYIKIGGGNMEGKQLINETEKLEEENVKNQKKLDDTERNRKKLEET